MLTPPSTLLVHLSSEILGFFFGCKTAPHQISTLKTYVGENILGKSTPEVNIEESEHLLRHFCVAPVGEEIRAWQGLLQLGSPTSQAIKPVAGWGALLLQK